MSVARRIDEHWHQIIAQLRHQAETGTSAAIITSTAKETPMSEQPAAAPASPLAELKSIIGRAVSKAEEIDEDALTAVKAIKGHPELAAALDDLAAIAEIAAQAALPAGWVADAVGGLRLIRNTFAPRNAAAA